MFKLESQPFICDIPAGNLLLTSAILFSGLIPNQVLHVLENLGCASISTTTFFRHQNNFCCPLCFHSRADIQGYSARYGSYTVLELPMGVVIR